MANILRSTETIIADSFTRYKGCIIERTGNGFITLRNVYATLQDAKQAIDNTFSSINLNIAR